MLRKSKNFISLPVVTLEDGQEIGSVKGLVINPEKRIITALVIDQKGWFKEQRVIPYIKVHSVGEDAITIEKSNSVAKWTSLSEVVQLVNQKIDLVGAKVVTEKGNVLGYVNEYFVDEENGNIVALDVSGKLIESLMKGKAQLPMDSIRTVGKDVLIAVEGAEERLAKQGGGFNEGFKDTLSSVKETTSETFSTIKETTSKLWESTWQKTKELGKSLPIVGSKDKGAADDADDITGEAAETKADETRAGDGPAEEIAAPVEEAAVEEPAAEAADYAGEAVEASVMPVEAPAKAAEPAEAAGETVIEAPAEADEESSAEAVEEAVEEKKEE